MSYSSIYCKSFKLMSLYASFFPYTYSVLPFQSICHFLTLSKACASETGILLSLSSIFSKDKTPDSPGSIHNSRAQSQSLVFRLRQRSVERRIFSFERPDLYLPHSVAALRHCAAIGFVFIVIYYIEDMFAI